MARFLLWLIPVLVGALLGAGYVFGFEAFEGEVRRRAEYTVERERERTGAVLSSLRERQIQDVAEAVERAGLGQAMLANAKGEKLSLGRLTQELERLDGPTHLVCLCDPRGDPLWQGRAIGGELSLSLCRSAFRGLGGARYLAQEDRLYQLLAVPVLAGDRIIAGVSVAREVEKELLKLLRGTVAMVWNGKILATNLFTQATADLQQKLSDLGSDAPKVLSLGGILYAAVQGSIAGAPQGTIVQLHSLERLATELYPAKLRYVFIGFGAFLVIIVLVVLIDRRLWTGGFSLVAGRSKAPAAQGAGGPSLEGGTPEGGDSSGSVPGRNERLRSTPHPGPLPHPLATPPPVDVEYTGSGGVRRQAVPQPIETQTPGPEDPGLQEAPLWPQLWSQPREGTTHFEIHTKRKPESPASEARVNPSSGEPLRDRPASRDDQVPPARRRS